MANIVKMIPHIGGGGFCLVCLTKFPEHHRRYGHCLECHEHHTETESCEDVALWQLALQMIDHPTA